MRLAKLAGAAWYLERQYVLPGHLIFNDWCASTPGRRSEHALQHCPATTKLSDQPKENQQGKAVRKFAMNIGFFGGSFDPIHRGHLTLAQAAASRYSLRRVLFVTANVPPHKQKHPLTPFIHRYAMVALATQDERGFVPSLLEAPRMEAKSGATNLSADYSIDTVRRLKQTIKKSDRLFFLLGIDAFRDIAKWREASALLETCDFVVASRLGYSLRDVAESLPEDLRPSAAVIRPFHKRAAIGDLVLPGVTVHMLEGVRQNVSATAIRKAAADGKPLARWLDPRVADYVRKHELYR
jgi:nicotinate-nucleotide adenylyltransferase